MGRQRFLNNFDTQFIAAVKSAPQTGTPATELDYGIIRISTGAAGALTNPTGGDFYTLTAYKRAGTVESNIEVMYVTAVDTSVVNETRLTVARAQEGTTAQSYVAGDYLSMRLTAAGIGGMLQVADLSSANPAALGAAAPGSSTKPAREDHVHPVPSAGAVGAEPTIAAATGTPTAQYWRGDKSWRDLATDVRAAVLTGLSTAINASVAATDSVLVAIGKLQAQLANYLPKSNGSATGLTVDGLNGGQLAGMRNAVINGAFLVNQRGVTGTVTLAAGAYGHDRWKAGSGGCTYTFSTTAGVTTLSITAGTLQQVIEGANIGTGTYTLSWVGTATGRINSGSYGASGTVSASLTAGTNQTVEFSTGTVSYVQLEPGSKATPFEFRPVGTELSLCQRYFNLIGASSYGIYASYYGAAGSSMSIPFSFPSMRATPTTTINNIGAWTQYNASSLALAANTNQTGYMTFTVTASGTGVVYTTGASTSISLSAEL